MKRLLLCLLVLISPPTSLSAQEVEGQSSTLLERVEAALSSFAVEPESELSAEESLRREALRATWQRALAEVQSAASWRAEEAKSVALEREAPLRLEALRNDENGEPQQLPSDLQSPTLAQLEQGEREAASILQEAESRETILQDEPEKRMSSRRDGSEAIAAAKAEIERLKTVATASTDPSGVEAEQTLTAAKREALEAKVAAIRAELSSYDARVELLLARREAAQRSTVRAREGLDAWREAAAKKRRAEAEDQEVQVDREANRLIRSFPSLKPLADQNELLLEQRAGSKIPGGALGILDRREQAQRQLRAAQANVERLRIQSKRLRLRTRAAEQSDATGLLLRREYELLEEVSTLEEGLQALQREIAELDYRLLVLGEENAELVEIRRSLDPYLQSLGALEAEDQRPEEELQQLRIGANSLLETKRSLLNDLIRETNATATVLTDLEFAKSEELNEVRGYREFVEERILWVRSVEGPPIPDARNTVQAFSWLIHPKTWGDGLLRTWHGLRESPGKALPLGMLVVALVVLRRSMKRRLVEVGRAVLKFRTDRLSYTWLAGVLTVALSLGSPLLLVWIGQRFLAPIDPLPTLQAAARGFYAGAAVLFAFTLVSSLSIENGLAEAHFRWSNKTVRLLRKLSRLFVVPTVLTTAGVALFDACGEAAYHDSLGRIIFIVGMGIGVAIVYLLFREESGLLESYFKRNPGNVIQRTRPLWYPLLLAIPVVLGVLALLGYYYSAMRLQMIVRGSLAFIGLLVLINAFLLRWLFATRRTLAVEQAKQRSAVRAEASGKESSDGRPKESVTAAFDEDAVDIPAIDTQTKKIFRASLTTAFVVGLYLIWSSVLPALRGLDRVQLWPTFEVVSESPGEVLGTEASASIATSRESAAQSALPGPMEALTSGAESAVSSKEMTTGITEHVITLGDLILFVLISIFVIVAAKNLPGLMELAVLQRLPLDAGARNAVTTIARYLIVIIGTTSAFGVLGIGWAQMQWLAAALTFGLAFGLQEIFANFVSGLIILLERPIRLGDVVTVGGVEGAVSKIRMRATTITDWNMRELLVPNKEFITGEIINWTLTEPTTRLVVPIGVAYGSDTQEVERVLLDVASRCANLAHDPKPHVLFKSFGESALDFELRVFLPNRDYWVQIRHWLNIEIDRAFREAGIEIPFPQRDLHIRSGLPERSREATPESRPGSSD